MKTRRTLFLLWMCLLAITSQARQVHVAGPSEFVALYDSALDGDTLMVQSGSYSTGFNLPAGKSITILASDTAEAIFSGQIGGGATVEGGSLIFDNVIIDRNNSYFVRHESPGALELLAWHNCEIRNVGRCLITSDHPDAIQQISSFENVELINCVYHDNNTGNYNMMWTKAPILNLNIEECTFYNNSGMEGIYSPRSSTSSSHTFTFRHNTVYQANRQRDGYTYFFCDIKNYFTGEESVYTIEDNLIISTDSSLVGGLVNAEMGFLYANNNLIYGYNKPARYQVNLAFNGTDGIVSEYSIEDMGIENISGIFLNPAEGDFTIYSTSPMATAASDGGVLGARRWLKEVNAVYTLQSGMYTGVDSLAGSIQGPKGSIEQLSEVSLTAVRNYGYKFIKWVDASGSQLSDSTTYSFVMDSDKEVYAVFENIPLYSLNIEVNGGGRVHISEPGKDGAYEWYEAGTELTLTATGNRVTEFIFWDYSEATPTKYLLMDKNTTVTATFASLDYVAGWDFDTDRLDISQNRPADYMGNGYADTTLIPSISLYYSHFSDDYPFTKGWWARPQADGFFAAAIWNYHTESGAKETVDGVNVGGSIDRFFYMKTSAFTTKGFKDIAVSYDISISRFSYTIYLLQYSYNNISWETAASHVLGSSFTNFCDTIENTGGKETLYLRWMPDITSEIIGDVNDVDATYFANIFILADKDGTSSLSNPNSATTKVAVNQSQLNVQTEGHNTVKLFSMDGRLLRQSLESDDFSWDLSGFQGIYILQIGTQRTKIAL
ncbi:MAG: DUF5123 domain-containing protein [Bacteroidales bacterium]|nr:DUF5123 domain-containing protein [Bacteroidales bacterium]